MAKEESEISAQRVIGLKSHESWHRMAVDCIVWLWFETSYKYISMLCFGGLHKWPVCIVNLLGGIETNFVHLYVQVRLKRCRFVSDNSLHRYTLLK